MSIDMEEMSWRKRPSEHPRREILSFSIRAAVADPPRSPRASPPWGSGITAGCPSTPFPTSPTCRCRSIPRLPAIPRWRSSSASPFPWRRPWPGLPGLEETRSLSRYGLSQVTVVFKDGTDIYFARQLINERLQEAKEKLPAGRGTGHGAHLHRPGRDLHVDRRGRPGRREAGREALTRHGPQDPAGLGRQAAAPEPARRDRGEQHRRISQAVPRDAAIPRKLMAYGLDFPRHRRGPAGATTPTWAPVTSSAKGEQYLVRAPGQVRDLEDIRRIVIQNRDGAIIRIQDVAEVGLGQGAPHRRRDQGRPGNGAGDGLHADGREQPRRGRAGWTPRWRK